MGAGRIKKRWLVATVVLILLLGWFFLPSNYYLRRAVRHLYPTVDDHVYFDNRRVVAGDPRPWPFDRRFGLLRTDSLFRVVSDSLETEAFLVVKDGRILFEEYGSAYDETTVSNSFSMAKSIISMLIGCAVEEGYIRNIHDPVRQYLDWIPSYEGSEMTIRDLLTMSAGLDWQESDAGPFSAIAQIYYGDNLPEFIRKLKLNRLPGREFEYQSGVTQILAALLEKQTGRTVSAYASEKIWTPVQAEQDALWTLDRKEGTEKAYCCYNAKARDFARLGQLMLDSGRWQGKPVVPKEYLAEAMQPDTSHYSVRTKGPNRFYGYQFWLLNYKGLEIPYMRGILGQYVFAIPAKNAVVVRLGRQRDKRYCEEQYYPLDVNTWLDGALSVLEQAERMPH